MSVNTTNTTGGLADRAAASPIQAVETSAPPRPAKSGAGGMRKLHQRLMYGLMGLGMALVLIPTVYIFSNIFLNGWRQLVLSRDVRPASFSDPAGFVTTLKNAPDPVSQYLRQQLPTVAQESLEQYAGGAAPSKPLLRTVIETLNQQVSAGAGLYSAERFANVRLRPETRRLLNKHKAQLEQTKKEFDPFGVGGASAAGAESGAGEGAPATFGNPEEVAELNRLLLEDAYPDQIKRGRFTLAFLTETPLDNGVRGGIGPAITGTFALMMGTILLALPLGIFAAIYLTEYARKGPVIRVIRMAIVNLAGVPSIVHGLFGLGLFIYFFGAKLDQIFGNERPVWQNQTLLWGSATLAVLVLPIVITTTEEALLSVPQSFREGSMGLGATRWQTIRRVVLPAATPGILTGAILAVGRAAGETAPILLTAALSWTSRNELPKLNQPVMALPYHLYYLFSQVANAPARIQYGVACALLLLVFSVNLSAIILRARLRRARKW